MPWVPPQHNFYIGVDVGYVHEKTCVSIITRALWASKEVVQEGWAWRARIGEPGWVWPHEIPAKAAAAATRINATDERPPYAPLLLRKLEQFRGRRQEDELVAFLKSVVKHREIAGKGWIILVDKVGAHSLFRRLQVEGLNPFGIFATGGNAITPNRHDPGWNVSKPLLYETAASVVNSGRLQVPSGLKLKDEFMSQLKSYGGQQNAKTGWKTYGNQGEAQHDDMVTAVGLPLFYYLEKSKHLDIKMVHLQRRKLPAELGGYRVKPKNNHFEDRAV